MTTDVIAQRATVPPATVPPRPVPEWGPPDPAPAPPGGAWPSPVPRALLVALVTLAGLVGLGIRLWFTFHSPSSADEAVVGILARSGLHGHVQAFYAGQQYGGTAEPYLIAAAFAVFGPSVVVGRLVLVVLAAVAALLVWRITLRIVGIRSVALLAGALAWSAPAITARDSVRMYGFRGVALLCGLVALLLSLRIADGRRGRPEFAGLGVALGLGWWSTPEILYVSVPVLALLVLGFVRTPSGERRRWGVATGVAVVAFAVGALPWIWSNARSRLGSFATGEFTDHRPYVGYAGRLGLFFQHVLPMDLGLDRMDGGHRFFGVDHALVELVFLSVLVAAVALCIRRGGSALALAAGVVAFPFVYALSPAAWAWTDGRYSYFLPPLLADVLAVGATEAVQRVGLGRAAASWLMAVALVVSAVLAVVDTRAVVSAQRTGFVATWGDPDAATLRVVPELEAAGIRTAYADYWVAYKLDFLSGGGLTVTTAGWDTDRSAADDAVVDASRRPAWLFVPMREARVDGTQFTSPSTTVTVDKVDERQFEGRLRRLGVPYRVLDFGILQAVVPARTVDQFAAGVPGASSP